MTRSELGKTFAYFMKDWVENGFGDDCTAPAGRRVNLDALVKGGLCCREFDEFLSYIPSHAVRLQLHKVLDAAWNWDKEWHDKRGSLKASAAAQDRLHREVDALRKLINEGLAKAEKVS